ncbi:MAG: hypothetical protein K2O31_01050, partial [Clostridia bacterium]|nr:hypothetical protein [Clostridia bacterium]
KVNIIEKPKTIIIVLGFPWQKRGDSQGTKRRNSEHAVVPTLELHKRLAKKQSNKNKGELLSLIYCSQTRKSLELAER